MSVNVYHPQEQLRILSGNADFANEKARPSLNQIPCHSLTRSRQTVSLHRSSRSIAGGLSLLASTQWYALVCSFLLLSFLDPPSRERGYGKRKVKARKLDLMKLTYKKESGLIMMKRYCIRISISELGFSIIYRLLFLLVYPISRANGAGHNN